MAKVLFPLPDRDFDVTEVAVPWALLREAGHEPVFATEAGATPACDPLLITGVVFGKLGARPDAIALYRELERAPEFVSPLRWRECTAAAFDALVLAGGHAPGMRQYLGSDTVQALTSAFFARAQPVAAICHGVLVAARARRADGQSVLHGLRTTCLPKYMERDELARLLAVHPASQQTFSRWDVGSVPTTKHGDGSAYFYLAYSNAYPINEVRSIAYANPFGEESIVALLTGLVVTRGLRARRDRHADGRDTDAPVHDRHAAVPRRSRDVRPRPLLHGCRARACGPSRCGRRQLQSRVVPDGRRDRVLAAVHGEVTKSAQIGL